MIRPLTSSYDAKAIRPPVLFVLLEAALLLSVPVIAWFGFQALLGTRAGQFVTPPSATEPGYIAAVAASPVTAFVEVVDGDVSGVTIVTQQSASEPGGALLLVWPTTTIDGVAVSDMTSDQVVPALEVELRLAIATVYVLDSERWSNVLGEHSLLLNNPDPVLDAVGEPLIAVGEAEIGAQLVADFIGRAAEGSTAEAVIVRRSLWWSTLLENPPASEDDIAALIRSVGAGVHTTADLPLQKVGGESVVDAEPAEKLIVSFVPFPAGVVGGDRLQVRLLDKAGGLDLASIARSLALEGYEVVQLGNADAFIDGPAQVVVPAGVTDERVNELAQLYQADTVHAADLPEQSPTVTLIVGSSAAETS